MQPAEFIAALWRRRIVILFVIIVVNMGSVAVVKYSTYLFEATAWLMFTGGAGANGFGSGDPNNAMRRDQALRSEVLIAQSEAVIARGVEIADVRKVLAEHNPAAFRPDIPPDRQAGLFVSSRLRVEVEPNSNLIRVSFRDGNPVFAARVANAISDALRERHLIINSSPETADFFKQQEQRYRDTLQEAYQALREYEVRTKTFSIEEERKLALARRDSVAAELAETRGKIVRQESELASLKVQIAALRQRITLPPEIYGAPPPIRSEQSRNLQQLSDDPPLLHVKIYQDSAQKLVGANSDLEGLHALERSQSKELQAVDERLLSLADRDEQYRNLRRRVERAESELEIIGKKRAEAEVETSWRANERLSSLQIVQPALQPLRPVFPRASLVLPLGAAASIVIGIAVAMLLEFAARFRHQQRAAFMSTYAAVDTSRPRIVGL